VVSDRLRGYSGLFQGKFSAGGYTYLTAFFTITPLKIKYDNIYFLADVNLVNFSGVATTVRVGLAINLYDVWDNTVPAHNTPGLPPSSDCSLTPSSETFSNPTAPYKLNLINNIYYDAQKILADPDSKFGLQDNSNKYMVGTYFDLNNQTLGQACITSQFVKTLSMHIAYGLFNGATPRTFDLEIKEITALGVRSIDTLNGDLFASVRGELTGATATDPSAETNNVYDAFIHILEDYDGIPKGLIDYGNLPTTRKNWHVGRTLTDRKNSVDYLNELCAHSFVAMFPTRNGKRGLRAFDYSSSLTPVAVHDFSVIGRDSIESYEKTDISQLFNNFLLQYNYDQGAGQFIRNFIVANVDKFATFPLATDVDANGVPLWYQCFGGLLGSPTFASLGYAESKLIWDMCKHSYSVNRTVKQAQGDISQLNWFVDRALFDPATTWGTGDTSSAYYLLKILAQGVTLQKGIITYSIPINAANMALELLDVISVTDVIFTNNVPKLGYLVSHEVITANDQIKLQVMLLPNELQPYPPVTVSKRRLMSPLAAPFTQGKTS
jgi:hypothetical protein